MQMINEVRFVGWVGHDLKLQKTTNGDSVVNFDLSTTESYQDPRDKKRKTVTDWHRIVAYGKIAENLAKFAKKGSLVYVDGKHKTGRKWTDKEGVTHHVSEIVVREFKMMPAGKTKEDSGNQEEQSEKAA